MEPTISLKRFAIVFAITIIAVAVVVTTLEWLLKISVPASATGIVAPMVASMDAGQRFFKKYGTVPESAFAWRASFHMTVVELAISLPLAAILMAVLMSVDGPIDWIFLLGLLFGIGCLIGLLSWVLKRYFLVMAAKNMQKAADRG
jgi:hypothetical protein